MEQSQILSLEGEASEDAFSHSLIDDDGWARIAYPDEGEHQLDSSSHIGGETPTMSATDMTVKGEKAEDVNAVEEGNTKEVKHGENAWLCLEQDETGNIMLSLLEKGDTAIKQQFGEWEFLDSSKWEQVFLLDDEIKARSLDKMSRAQSIALGLSGASAVALTGMSTSILGTMVLLAATDLLKLGYKGIEPTSRNKSEMLQKVLCKSCILGAISCGTSAIVGSALLSASKVYISVPAVAEACMTGAVCSVGSEIIERKATDDCDLKLRKEKNMVVAALWGALSSGAGGVLKPLGETTIIQQWLEQGGFLLTDLLKQ
mmetsp:Transcript_4512/g.5227  ORF Transcript_4512/g.5227 Transcript_4512/m.5227 type:complete len:316 (+) Transcript_4512:250-1197(+)|eukprot:CAMPEP_0184020212 /NCGR_PEP_ID=MMETSP0954-20121128/9216_1 /TAXON_ID=627963 /ORGANISM="Aplanochytrium sp, Strain PBS07" /LENGTH=315 /DNA_ID=CAMNT_0026302033 /DNA_START=240 /DNA_END=1187 /DNA_ORIENTATION=+